MPTPLKKNELAERRAQLRLLPKIGRPYRGRPALVAPTSRTQLIALVATLLVHVAAGAVLWNMANRVEIIEPPKPLEISLLSPPPEPPAIPEPPPPPEVVPPPPPPEPELPPPPEPEPPPPPPPEPEPMPVATPEPPPPPKPKPLKKPVVKPAAPVKQPEPVKEVPPPVAIAAPPAPAPAPVEQAVVAPLFDAAYLNNPAPAYPRSARRLGLEGTVILRVLVSPAGKPEQVRVETSSGTQILDEAALNAVRNWSFVPARQGDRSVTASVDVPIRFNLN